MAKKQTNIETQHPAKVWFIPLNKNETTQSIAEKTKLLMKKSGIGKIVKEKTIVAVKQHFGEHGNEGYIKPEVTKEVVKVVKTENGYPLLVETNTLYYGHRSNTHHHLLLAHDHGFTIENTGAPVTIMDGLNGQNQMAIKIPGEHFKEVFMVSDLPFFGSLIVLSHVKGHMLCGMGGAIKNLGMGFSSRAGKLSQHADFNPQINDDKCTRCKLCVQYCPEQAIAQQGKEAAKVDLDKCIGCGECYTACRFGAISFQWESGSQIQEKMAEHALGAVVNHNKKVGYINFINHVTKQCDCWGGENPVIFDNIGILAGFDPVAIDKASQDITKEKLGVDVFKELWPAIDATVQLKHGEKIGLGTQNYELIEIN